MCISWQVLDSPAKSLILFLDIDGDGIISRNDLIKMIDMITDQNMSSAKKDQIITAVS